MNFTFSVIQGGAETLITERMYALGQLNRVIFGAWNHNAAVDTVADNFQLCNDTLPPGPRVNITAYRPQTSPFLPTEVPEATEDTIGVGVRSNGDDDNGNNAPDWSDLAVLGGDDDLVEISLDFGAAQLPQGTNYYLRRSNTNVRVWETNAKGSAMLDLNDEQEVVFGPGRRLWVEWVNPTFAAADATLIFEARDAQTDTVVGTADSVRVFRFTSAVIVIGGFTQRPSDPLERAKEYSS